MLRGQDTLARFSTMKYSLPAEPSKDKENNMHLKEMSTFSKAALSKLYCLLPEKGSTLKGGNFFFPFRIDSFSEEAW